MMSKKQLAAMLCLHIIYLLLGASIFYHIESPLELAIRQQKKLEQLEIQELLLENYNPSDENKRNEILEKLSEYCGKPMVNATLEEAEGPVKWDFYHSFFFSYTVVSTIGYGNLAPTTSLGRILMIFYALFGIPINGILFANLGEYFGMALVGIYQRYKSNHESRVNRLDHLFNGLGMFGQITMYLIPGFLFFIFLPACLFVLFEGWDYVLAVYYAFVTLTTIGFGDYVAGTENRGFGIYFIFYEVFLIVWITFGLGYLVMLFGFITRGMRSKKIHDLEHKIVSNIKATQNKILSGFSKDVNYLRRIINEAYLMRVKPVYCDEDDDFPRLYRSASCPTFTFDAEPRTPAVKRRRANSDNLYISAKDILRIQSDTDLLCIDRTKTFMSSPMVKPAEILARVVNALGTIASDDEDENEGVHMFSDRDILATEKPKKWSIGSDIIIPTTPDFKRNRAYSIAIPGNRKMSHSLWSHTEPEDKESPKRGSKFSLQSDNVIDENAEIDYSKPPSLISKLNPFRHKAETDAEKGLSPADYIKKTVRGRMSMFTGTAESFKDKIKPRKDSIMKLSKEKDEDSPPPLPEEIRNYQNRTKLGRGSLFASDLERYQTNTSPRRPSLFGGDIDSYKNKTKKGRLSLLSGFSEDTRRSSLAEMNEDEQVEALENTSVADLIRALALLQAGNDPSATPNSQRKQGTVVPPTPGLMDLLTGSSGVSAIPPSGPRVRRGSVRPPDAGEDPLQAFANSRRRRLSVRPTPSFAPVLETVRSGQEFNASQKPRQRRGSLYSPPPPYSPQIQDPIIRQRRFTPTSEEAFRPRRSGPVAGPVAKKVSRTGLFANIKPGESLEEAPTPPDSTSRESSYIEAKSDEHKS